MNRNLLLLLVILSLAVSCTAGTAAKNDSLYADTWELEYITGPRITFAGLFPDRKPVIRFSKDPNIVTGNSGCNGYSTQYTMDGKQLTFAEPDLSTMMYCGDGENVFRKTMRQVDSYRMTDGKLELLMGDTVMMRFKPTVK